MEFLPSTCSTHDSGRWQMLQIPKNVFVRTEGFGCELTECSLTATLQSMCPGECFRFLPSRATRGISASVKASWLDGLHGKVDHCWTWRRRFKTYCFPFFWYQKEKKRFKKKVVKGPLHFSENRTVCAFNDEEKGVFVPMIVEYDSYAQSERLWLNCCFFYCKTYHCAFQCQQNAWKVRYFDQICLWWWQWYIFFIGYWNIIGIS